MQRIDFNKGWMCKCLTRDEAAYPVTLPHDAMLSEPRTQESTGEGNIGWYIGGDYEYTKKFTVPKEYQSSDSRLDLLCCLPSYSIGIITEILLAFPASAAMMRFRSA